jgi:hypothetical protein
MKYGTVLAVTALAVGLPIASALADGQCWGDVEWGDLVIHCDNASNVLRIEQTGDERFTVTGTGTLIDGVASKVFSNVDDSIIVDFNGGSDNLNLVNSSIEHNLIVYGGSGLETLRIDDSQVAGDVRWYTSSGGSDLEVRDTVIADDLILKNGWGFDDIKLDSAIVWGCARFENGNGDSSGNGSLIDIDSQSHIDGDLVIVNGSGFDSFHLENSSVGWDLEIWNGSGGSGVFLESPDPTLPPPIVGDDLWVSSCGGDDSFRIKDARVIGSVELITAWGDTETVFDRSWISGEVNVCNWWGFDTLDVDDSAFDCWFTVRHGSGGSESRLHHSTYASGLRLEGGCGVDDVELSRLIVEGWAKVLLGAGNDSLHVSDSTFGGLNANGESGFDTFDNGNGNSFDNGPWTSGFNN